MTLSKSLVSRQENRRQSNQKGKVLVTLDEQIARFKEEVLNIQRDGIVVEAIDNPPYLPIRTESPSMKEIFEAVKRLKNGKAAGVDAIPGEVLKVDANPMTKMLKPLFDEIWFQGGATLEQYPEDWIESLIVKLAKKGDLSSCGNWRGIALSVVRVRHGDLLSLLLFLVIMDKVMRAATWNKPKGIVGSQNKCLEDRDYADDPCLLAHTQQDMQAKLKDLESELAKVGLVVNTKKTEEIRVNARNNRPLLIGNETINRVENFTYLGSKISADGGAMKGVSMRIQKASGAFAKRSNVWKSTNITKQLNMKIFNAYFKSVLLYGCETWFVTNEVNRKLQVFVNSCYRRILRIWWNGNPNDWPSNDKLQQKADQQDINKEIQMR
ncbi:uncharacterized protein, partial [Chironomus tepperi]|uniref:uncharacterized protein n=1 Tax=Chironomus tepperi TaxID=113505 RepID=UPI00391F93DC